MFDEYEPYDAEAEEERFHEMEEAEAEEAFFNDDGEEEFDDDADPGDMDGDHESALASAGFGVDESYEHDTPIGHFYDDMGVGE